MYKEVFGNAFDKKLAAGEEDFSADTPSMKTEFFFILGRRENAALVTKAADRFGAFMTVGIALIALERRSDMVMSNQIVPPRSWSECLARRFGRLMPR